MLRTRRRRTVFLAAVAASLVAVALVAASVFVDQRRSLALSIDEGDIVLGSADAPVMVVEYFSFSCSHCAQFHREVYPDLRDRYVETGLVRFVLRDFPLNEPALKAAQAAHCAGPGRYLELTDALWESWDAWINRSDPEAGIVEVLQSHGLAAQALEACMQDPDLETRALQSLKQGSEDYGVDRTPSFVINGETHRGFMPLGRFEEIIADLTD